MRITFLLPFIGLAGGVKSTFELAGRLQERGFTEGDVRKILGENILRVFEEVWGG